MEAAPAAQSPRDAPAFTRLSPDGRRRQILDAARRTFSEQPYASVSMNELARAAGVTRGLIHHYFGGKTELFRSVVMELAADAPALADAGAAQALEQTVEDGVTAWLDFVQEHRELALIIGAGMHPEDPGLELIVQAARDEIVARVIESLTGSREAGPELRFLIRSYLGLADAAAREWLYYRRASREQVHVTLARGLTALMAEVLPPLSAAA